MFRSAEPQQSSMPSESFPRSILRVVSVLKSFTPDGPELTASDISRKVGMPKTTTHRMLATLADAGLLDRNAEKGKYTIGPALYELGILYLSTTDILKAAEPVIKTLNDLTRESVNMGIFDKGHVIVVMKEEAKHAFRYALHVGSVLPAYASAMGKSFLSELTEAEIDSLYPEEQLRPIAPKTIATRTELKRDLKQIRKTGVAFNRAGAHVGVEGIGSAIRDASGRVVAAVSISVAIFNINQAIRERLATLVKLGCNLVSYRLGYKDPANPVRDIAQICSWWEQNQKDSASRSKLAQTAATSHSVPVGEQQGR